MELNFSDIVELIRVLVWPVFAVFIFLYFEEGAVVQLNGMDL